MQVDVLAARLAVNPLPLRDADEVTAQLRDKVDVLYTPDAEGYVRTLLPHLSSLLDGRVPPSLSPRSTESIVRQRVLELLLRVNYGESLKPLAADLARALLRVVELDNEDNGVLAVKCLSALFKTFRSSSSLEPVVPRVFSLFAHLFRERLPLLVTQLLNDGVDATELGARVNDLHYSAPLPNDKLVSDSNAKGSSARAGGQAAKVPSLTTDAPILSLLRPYRQVAAEVVAGQASLRRVPQSEWDPDVLSYLAAFAASPGGAGAAPAPEGAGTGPASSQQPGSAPPAGPSGPTTTTLRSRDSFKVLGESCLFTLMVLQLYVLHFGMLMGPNAAAIAAGARDFLTAAVGQLGLPCLADLRSIAAGNVPSLAGTAGAHAYAYGPSASSESSPFRPPPPKLVQDFSGLQTKLATMLVYLVRITVYGYTPSADNPHAPVVAVGIAAVSRVGQLQPPLFAGAVMRGLFTVSPECPGSRKEVIQLMRMFYEETRGGERFPHLRCLMFPAALHLLDDAVLVGAPGCSSHVEGVRGAAHTALADLLHHVFQRAEGGMSLASLAAIQERFAVQLAEGAGAALTANAVSIRLLAAFIHSYFACAQSPDPAVFTTGRALLADFLAIVVAQLTALKDAARHILAAERRALAQVDRQRRAGAAHNARVAAAADLTSLTLKALARAQREGASPSDAGDVSMGGVGSSNEPDTAGARAAASTLLSGLASPALSPWLSDARATEIAGERVGLLTGPQALGVSQAASSTAGGAMGNASNIAAVTPAAGAATGSGQLSSSLALALDAPQAARVLVDACFKQARTLLWSLCNYRLNEAEKAAAAAQRIDTWSPPPTSGVPLSPTEPTVRKTGDPSEPRPLPTVADMDAGGPNGLGASFYGATLSEEELRLVQAYISAGVDCMALFTHSPSAQVVVGGQPPLGSATGASSGSSFPVGYGGTSFGGEATEIQETFAMALTCLDKNQVRDVFAAGGLTHLLSRVFASPILQYVPQFLMTNPATCRPFGELMLGCLTRHVRLLNTDDGDESEEWAAPTRMPGASSEAGAPAAKGPGDAPNSGGARKRPPPLDRAVSDASRTGWAFNEDGEFDGVTGSDPDEGGWPRPDDEEEAARDSEWDEDAAWAQAFSAAGNDAGSAFMPPFLSGTAPATRPPSVMAAERATTWLRLIKLVIISLASQSPESGGGTSASVASILEPLLTLKPFIGPLVRATLKNALACRHPVPHLYLLRTLFRVVASATTKHPDVITHLYMEFAPLMPQLIDSLMRLHAGVSEPSLRDTALELCITVPLRLSMQLPFIGRMMKPLCVALRSRDDRGRHLPSMALKTLEFWSDNLTSRYLAGVLSENGPGLLYDLMSSISALVKPPPAANGADAMRLLGKLGGLARRWLATPNPLPLLGPSATPPGGGDDARGTVAASASGADAPSGLTLRLAWATASESGALYTPPTRLDDHDLDAQEAASAGGGAAGRVPLAPANGDGSVDLPLDTVLRHAHRLLVRHFSLVPLHTAGRPREDDVAAPLPPARARRRGRRRLQPTGASRVRDIAFPSCAGAISASVSGLIDDVTASVQAPSTRRRRLEDGGEDVAVSSSGVPRASFAQLAGGRTEAARSGVPPHALPQQIAYDSDSDSGGEDDGWGADPAPGAAAAPTSGVFSSESTQDGFVDETTPEQAVDRATRGPLVAKRHAWTLLSACVGVLMQRLPQLGSVDPDAASAHLYAEGGRVAVGARPAGDEPLEPLFAGKPSAAASASGSGPRASPVATAASALALRTLQLELLRALAVASVDLHLGSRALPVFTGLVRQYALLGVARCPLPVPAQLPPALRPSAPPSTPPSSPHVVEVTVGDHAPLRPVREVALAPSGGASAGSASVPMPDETADPRLLISALVSLACDQPWHSPQHASSRKPSDVVRPVALALLDELHAVSCATARVPPTVASAAAAGEGYGAFASDPARRLHAVSVTGRAMLDELASQAAAGCSGPYNSAQRGALHLITAAVARLHPSWAVSHAPALLKGALHVLASHGPECAAATVAAAFRVVTDVTNACATALAATPVPGSILKPDPDLLPLEVQAASCLLTPESHRLVSSLVSLASTAIVGYRGCTREAAAFILGALSRTLTARQRGSASESISTVDLCRGMLTLLLPAARSGAIAFRALRQQMRYLRQGAQVGQLFALSGLLNLIADARAQPADAYSAAAAAGAGAAPSWSECAVLVTALADSASATSASASGGAGPLQLVDKVADILRFTKLLDPFSPSYSPAALAAGGATLAGAQTKAAMAAEGLTGSQAHVSERPEASSQGSQAVGPLTTFSAYHAGGSYFSIHASHVGSAANPPQEAVPDAMQQYDLTAAATPWPYPMRRPNPPAGVAEVVSHPIFAPRGWSQPATQQAASDPAASSGQGGSPASRDAPLPGICSMAEGINVTGPGDATAGLADPYGPVAQVGDGRLTGHLAPLPVSGWSIPPATVVAPDSADGTVEGLLRETWLRCHDPSGDFRPLHYRVLLRMGAMRVLEGVYRALPSLLLSPPADLAPRVAPVRAEAFATIFECYKLPAPAPELLGAGLVASDRVLLPDHPAHGHLRTLLLATVSALAALQDAVVATNTGGSGASAASSSDGAVLRDPSASLPRDQLHMSLRPLLTACNLWQAITPELVEVLGCLLTRIGWVFNASMVPKLENDLRNWFSVERTRNALTNTGREPDSAGAIGNLFHLLPVSPSAYLPSLVSLSAGIERKLHLYRNRGILTSPMRRPLARFLSRYPAECAPVVFALGRSSNRLLLNSAMASSLLGAIEHSDASGFVSHLSKDGLPQLLTSCFGHLPCVRSTFPAEASSPSAHAYSGDLSPEEALVVQYAGLRVISAMHRHHATRSPAGVTLLSSSPLLCRVLLELWATPAMRSRAFYTPDALVMPVAAGRPARRAVALSADPQGEGDVEMGGGGGGSDGDPTDVAPSRSGSPVNAPQQPTSGSLGASELGLGGSAIAALQLPLSLRESRYGDVTLCLTLMQDAARGYLREERSRSAAAAQAVAGEDSDSDDPTSFAPRALPPRTVGVISTPTAVTLVLAVTDSLVPHCRVDTTRVRLFLAAEVATAPSRRLRTALLTAFLAPPTSTAPGSPAEAAGLLPLPPSHQQLAKAGALRVLVTPLLKHAFACEDHVARLHAAGEEAAARIAYVAAGGAPDDADDEEEDAGAPAPGSPLPAFGGSGGRPSHLRLPRGGHQVTLTVKGRLGMLPESSEISTAGLMDPLAPGALSPLPTPKNADGGSDEVGTGTSAFRAARRAPFGAGAAGGEGHLTPKALSSAAAAAAGGGHVTFAPTPTGSSSAAADEDEEAPPSASSLPLGGASSGIGRWPFLGPALRTPSTRGTNRVGGGSASRSGGWPRSGGSLRGGPFTPFGITTPASGGSVAGGLGAWAEAAASAAAAAGAQTPSAGQAAAGALRRSLSSSSAASAAGTPSGGFSKSTFAPRYAFPRLINSSVMPLLLRWLWAAAVVDGAPGGASAGRGGRDGVSSTRGDGASSTDPSGSAAGSHASTPALTRASTPLSPSEEGAESRASAADGSASLSEPASAPQSGDLPMASPSASSASSSAGGGLATFGGHVCRWNDELKAEVLRCCEAVVGSMGRELIPHRKEVIRCGWHMFKAGDVAVQGWAYALVCRYVQVYETPLKHQLQLMLALLRTCATSKEGRDLARRSLNLLLPSMVLRNSEEDWRKAVRHVRKTLADEMHTLGGAGPSGGGSSSSSSSASALAQSPILPLWGVLVDHARLFFHHRSFFLSIMLGIVHKALEHRSLPSSASASAAAAIDAQKTLPSPLLVRALAVDLLAVVAGWQAQARLEYLVTQLDAPRGTPLPLVPEEPQAQQQPSQPQQPSSARGVGGSPASSTSSGSGTKEPPSPFPAPHSGNPLFSFPGQPLVYPFPLLPGCPSGLEASNEQLVELTLGHSVRSAVVNAEAPDSRHLSRRSLQLFTAMLRLWPDTPFKAPSFMLRLGGPAPRSQEEVSLPQRVAYAGGTPAYQGIVFETFLALSASEGRSRDSVSENAGFLMPVLMCALGSGDRRVGTLMRRLVRRMLTLYPPSKPTPHLMHVRFYVWAFTCIAVRLAAQRGLSIDKQVEEGKLSGEQNECAGEERQMAREESRAIHLIAMGWFKPPFPTDAPFTRPTDLPKPSWDRWEEEGGVTRYEPALRRLPGGITAAVASRMFSAERDDDEHARLGWRAVRLLSHGVEVDGSRHDSLFGPPGDANMLCLARLLRDVGRVAPATLRPLQAHLFALFTRLFEDHVGPDAHPLDGSMAASDSLAVLELRQVRAACLTVLAQLLTNHRQSTLLLSSLQRSPLLVMLMKLLQRSTDQGILRTVLRTVSGWMFDSPIVHSSVAFGLTQFEKQNFLQAASALALPTSGPTATHPVSTAYAQRVAQLGDAYPSLQSQYYRLLLLMAYGSPPATASVASAVAHARQVTALAEGRPPPAGEALLPQLAGSRPPLWLLRLLKGQLVTMAACGSEPLRRHGMAVLASDARVSRWRALADEVSRARAAAHCTLAAARMTAGKRARKPTVTAPGYGPPIGHALAPGLSYSLEHPARAVLPGDLSRTIANPLMAASAGGGDGETVSFALALSSSHGAEDGEQWHANVDAGTLAALEDAFAAAACSSGDRRSSAAAFAGVDGSEASPLNAVQDILTAEWEGLSGYSWLPAMAGWLLAPLQPQLAATAGAGGGAADGDVDMGGAAAVSAPQSLSSAVASFRSSVGADASASALATSLLAALSGASQVSLDLSHSLVSTLLPAAWTALTPVQRERLGPHVPAFLTRDLHAHQVQPFPQGGGVGSLAASMERAMGVTLLERPPERGMAPNSGASEHVWSVAGPSLAAAQVAAAPAAIATPLAAANVQGVGSAPAMPGSLTNGEGGLGGVHASGPSAVDLTHAPMLPLLLRAFASCSPAPPLPPEVLAYAARTAGNGCHEIAVVEGEAAVETALATRDAAGAALVAAETKASAAVKALAASASTAGASTALSVLLAPMPEGVPEPDYALAFSTAGRHAGPIADLVAARRSVASAKTTLNASVHGLLSAYSALGVDDLPRGLQRRFVTTFAAARALDFEMHGQASEAQETLTSVMTISTKEIAEATEKCAVWGVWNQGGQANAAPPQPAASPASAPPGAGDAAGPTVAREFTAGEPMVDAGVSSVLALSSSTSGKGGRHAPPSASAFSSRKRPRTLDEILSGSATSSGARLPPGGGSDGEGADAGVPAKRARGAGGSSTPPSAVSATDLSSVVPAGSPGGSALVSSVLAVNGSVNARAEEGPPGAIGTVPAPPASSTMTYHVTARLPHPADVGQGENLLRVLAAGPPPPGGPALSEPFRPLPIVFWRYVSEDNGSPPSAQPVMSSLPPASEIEYLEERWVSVTRGLCQWNTLAIFADRHGDEVLAAEAYARTGNWTYLSQVVKRSGYLLEAARNPSVRMAEVQLALGEQRPLPAHAEATASLVDATCSQALAAAATLPLLPGPALESQLCLFRRLLEARDAAAIMHALRNFHAQAATASSTTELVVPDIKSVLLAWRDRLPNAWDSIGVWDGVMSTRQHLFNAVASGLQTYLQDARDMAAIYDGPWTTLTQARAARRLGQRVVAHTLLGKMPSDGPMDVTDAFHRTRESVLSMALPEPFLLAHWETTIRRQLVQTAEVFEAALEAEARSGTPASLPARPQAMDNLFANVSAPLESPLGGLRGGLSLLNATHLGHFDDAQAGELLRLSGTCSVLLGGELWPSAYASFSLAAATHRTGGKVWLSWGAYLEQLYSRARLEAMGRRSTPPEAPAASGGAPPAAPTRYPTNVLSAAKLVYTSASAAPPPPVPAPAPAPAEGGDTVQVKTETAAAAGGVVAPSVLVLQPPGATAEGAPASAAAAAEGEPTAASYSSAAAPAPASTEPPYAEVLLEVGRQAMAALLQAVSLRCPTPSLQLGRVMWLMASVNRDAHSPYFGSPLAPDALSRAVATPPYDSEHVCHWADGSPLDRMYDSLYNQWSSVPVWLWAAWIPQLLSALSRPEHLLATTALRALAAAHPHAVYPLLRSALHVKAEAANTPAGHSAHGGQSPAVTMRAYTALAELQTWALRLHAPLGLWDALCEAANPAASGGLSRLPPEAEAANALAGAAATIEKTFFLTLPQDKARDLIYAAQAFEKSGTATPVTELQERARDRLAERTQRAAGFITDTVRGNATMTGLFPPSSSDEPQQQQQQQDASAGTAPAAALRASRFHARYRSAVERDLCKDLPAGDASSTMVANPDAPRSVEDMVRRLRAWQRALLATMPSLGLSVADVCPALEAAFALGVGGCDEGVLEMPGQGSSVPVDQEPLPPRCVTRVTGLEPTLTVALSGASGGGGSTAGGATPAHWRLTLRGSDGCRHAYSVSPSNSMLSAADARTGQLQAFMNAAYARHVDARSRAFVHVVPPSLPLSRSLRLAPEGPSAVSLLGLLEAHLAASMSHVGAVQAGGDGTAPHSISDLLCEYGRATMAALEAGEARGVTTSFNAANAAWGEAQLASFRAVASCVPLHAMGGTLACRVAGAQGWVGLRSRLTTQVAAHSFATLVIGGGSDRLPGRVGIEVSSGGITASDFRFTYGQGGFPLADGGSNRDASLDPVPFRLTRGLATALGHSALIGGLMPAIVAADRAVCMQWETLWPAAALLYRDDAMETRGPVGAYLQPQPPQAGGGGGASKPEDEDRASHRRAVMNTTALWRRVTDHNPAALSSKWLRLLPCGGEQDKLMSFPVPAAIDKALSEDALARMPAGWHPWW